jgi:hypothetical protein
VRLGYAKAISSRGFGSAHTSNTTVSTSEIRTKRFCFLTTNGQE